jgi:hypothetical protein
LRLDVFALGVLMDMGLKGLQVGLCFGDAFVYQTIPLQHSYSQFNMKIAKKASTLRKEIDGF